MKKRNEKERKMLLYSAGQLSAETAERPDYESEITAVIRSKAAPLVMKERLEDYHESDIAGALDIMSPPERRKLYRILEPRMLSGVLECAGEGDAGRYLDEIDLKKIPAVISAMETDAAVKLLRGLSREKRTLITELLDDRTRDSIRLTDSFAEDEIGSRMTANFILIKTGLSIKQAMSSLIEQAARNDNIATLFVEDEEGVFCGAIDLKNLITARQDDALEGILMSSFPYVYGQETVDDCLESLKGYSESSIPVLDNSNRLIGVITAQSILQASDDALGEDYARLAGLTAAEDMNEPVAQSMRKRLPWLMALLCLGLAVSSVVGTFERVISQLTIIMAFQSLVLDMAGNVGTQSLAVTIRVLTAEGLSLRQKLTLVSKELKIGLGNGLILGVLSAVLIGLYIFAVKGRSPQFAFAVSGCIGVSLLIAMVAASATGTLIPMFFKKIKIDPAVASGPLITTVNDLVAVVSYYGLSWLFLLKIFRLG